MLLAASWPHGQPRRPVAAMTASDGFVGLLIAELLQVGDHVEAVLLVLQACKSHGGAGNEGARLFQVLEQIFLGPQEAVFTGLLVGSRVGEALDRTRLASDQMIE